MPRHALRTLLLFAVLPIGGTLPADEDTPGQQNQRILRFPEDRAVGTVYRRPARQGSYLNTILLDWEELAEARGSVSVPNSDDVRLDVSQVASRELSFLDRLGLDDIQYLNLSETDANDAALEHVGRLSGLRILDLSNTRITDAGIRHLAGLNRLNYIRLIPDDGDRETFGVGDASLAVLEGLAELEGIDLRETKVTNAGLEELARRKTLSRLNLPGPGITDAGLVHLKELPRLEFLWIGADSEAPGITNDGMRHIGELASLRWLNLTGTKVTDDGLKSLKNLTRLEKLSVRPGRSGTGVTEKGIAHLEPLVSLRELTIDRGLGDSGAQLISRLKSIRNVGSTFSVTDAGLADLATLPHLEGLSLKGVTDAELDQVARMTSLKTLTLLQCPATDDGLAKLATLRNLEILYVYATRVSGPGLKHLSELPSLTRLILSFGTPEEGFHGANPTLRHVGELRRLKGLTLVDYGALTEEHLMGLAGLSDLEFLRIEGIEVGDLGAFHLNVLGSLKILSLEDGVMTDAGLAEIAKLCSLEFLHLRGFFTDEGLSALRQLKSLRQVFLSSPNVTDEGVRSLAAAVPSIRSVERRPFRTEDAP